MDRLLQKKKKKKKFEQHSIVSSHDSVMNFLRARSKVITQE